MFTTYSSGSSQDSLHAEIGRRPKFAPRRTRLAVLLVASTLFGAVSLATSGAALAAVHRPRGADHNADQMPDRGSNPGQPAAVVRHQLGQSGSR